MRDGSNWYAYCGGNPVGFVDPSGLFGSNTKLKLGIIGNTDVVVLQRQLSQLGYLDISQVMEGTFDAKTLEAVNKYKTDYGLWNFGQYQGVVGETTWTHMGLTVDNAIEVGGNFGTPEANAKVLFGEINGPSLQVPLFNADSTVWETGSSSKNDDKFGLSLFSGEAGVLKESFEGRYAGAAVDVFHAKGRAEATSEYVGVEGLAEVIGPQGNVNIPLFGSGYDLVFTGELSLVGVGGNLGWSKEKGFGGKAALGIGWGAYINIKKAP